MRMRKLKLLLGFYKYDLAILFMFFISIFLLIKSTDYGYSFNWDWLKIFQRFRYGNDIVFNISIGFIVSTIFYFINVFWPKFENMNKYNDILKFNIEVIYEKLSKIFIMILDEKDTKVILNCSIDRLKQSIEIVDPDIRFQHEGVENNINKEILNCYGLVLRHTEYLIEFHGIIPVELLRILINIKAPGIMLNMSMIGGSNKYNFKNWENELIELHNCLKELALFKDVFIK